MATDNEIATINKPTEDTGKDWIRRWIDTAETDGSRINRFRVMAGPNAKRAKQFVEVKIGPTDTPESVANRIQSNVNNSRQNYVCVQALYAGQRMPTDTRVWTELEDPEIDSDDDDKPMAGSMREIGRMLQTQIAHNQFMIGTNASQGERMLNHLLKENERMSSERNELEKTRIKMWEAMEDLEDRRSERERKSRQTEALINGASTVGQSVLMYLAKGRGTGGDGATQHPSVAALGKLLSSLNEEQAAIILGTLNQDQALLFATMAQTADYGKETEVIDPKDVPTSPAS